MEVIRDVLFIKSVERSLGRKLSKEELDVEERDGELQLRLGNGESIFIQIPRLKFPDELLSELVFIPGPANKLVRVPEIEGWQQKKTFNRNLSVWDAFEKESAS